MTGQPIMTREEFIEALNSIARAEIEKYTRKK